MGVSIVEVSPRDGLQNEAAIVPAADKLALIGALAASGVRRIEAVSFVNPKRVPQMADAEEVSAGLPRGHVSWIGLVLNERGLDRAIAAGMDEVNVVVVATDTFSRRNQGVDTDAAIGAWSRIAGRARESGLRTTVTIGAAFGCPFEGEVPLDRLRSVVARCADAGPDELALADTIGVGVPAQVREIVAASDLPTTVTVSVAFGCPFEGRVDPARVEELCEQLDGACELVLADTIGVATPTRVRRLVERVSILGRPVGVHLHNTRNTGYANAVAALEASATVFDASLGGVGGCPYAPKATGNIATEDLLYLLHRSGFPTGMDVDALLPLGERLGALLGHQVPGQLARAGVFP